ncbi:MAG: hypothetical protein NTV34_06990, partial [Proteobacteria bacterium]|nr:hypothetical protein [Pseudomonadota bacterium]
PLTSCGSNAPTQTLRDDPASETVIAASIETESNGSFAILAAVPEEYSSMEFCVLDQSAQCVKPPVPLIFERSVAKREIYRIVELLSLADKSVILLIAEHSNGTKKQQKIRISLKGIGSLPGTGALNWKMVLMASDQGNTGAWINAFDNARKKLKQIFTFRGVDSKNVRELSLHPNQQNAGVRPASAAGFKDALKSFGAPGPNDACLVHMTVNSHLASPPSFPFTKPTSVRATFTA